MKLLPAEQIALTIARARYNRSDPILPNTAIILLFTIDRLIGNNDWSKPANCIEADEPLRNICAACSEHRYEDCTVYSMNKGAINA